MGTKTTGKFCSACQANVMAQKNTPNHILHIIISLITLGLWVPIWLLISLFSVGQWRCTRCGHHV